MYGVLLGVAAAVFKAGKSLHTKTAATRTDDYLTAWGTRVISVIFLALAVWGWLGGIPELGPNFWWALPLVTVLFSAFTLLSTRALRVSDLSLIAPLFALSPVLVLLSSAVILGEIPTLPALVGIFCIVGGAYSLNLRRADRGLLEPFRALGYDRGARYALGAVAVSALLPPLDKIGLQSSDPVFWAFIVHVCVAAVLTPVALRWAAANRTMISGYYLKPLVLAGLFNSLLWIAQTMAYEVTLVVYVTALKRLSILLSVGFGYWYFHEDIHDRLLGAVLIVVGSILILLG